MTLETRRTFLKQAAVATAALAAWPAAHAWSASSTGTLRAWRTAGQDRLKPIEVAGWQEGAAEAGIKIDTSTKKQEVLGFGGAFTDATCYLLSRMEPGARARLMEELVGASGLKFSVARTCIGASDYSRNAYSFDEGEPDPELKRFSIAHDREYILPTLRDAQKANPELFLFSAPWSPPGWMKAGGSMLGGSMRKKYFAPYAQYFVKFLEGYKTEGVNIRAVTTQNEVDTDQDGRMPAALWGQEYEAEFIRDHLGPALKAASLDTKIWLLDHNYSLAGRVIDTLSDPGVAQFVDGVAWHGYVGNDSAMTRVHDAYPSKSMYWTEGGPDYKLPDYATDYTKWSATIAGILGNWGRCVVSWNLVLDEQGKPNIGPFDCGGLVTLNSKTQEITRSGQYWALAHYSKFIERGARVVGSSGAAEKVSHVALQNPDGGHVLVVANQGSEQKVSVGFEAKTLSLEMPADSVTTVVW